MTTEEPSTPDTERHDTSWSANLEHPEHAESRERVVQDARSAIERTAPGRHVNLVTHEAHGHPSSYLYPVLEDEFHSLDWEFVDRCGCGGFVTRVYV
ncbi:CGCGG family rSAM-modified RiPP protein [Haloferax sp. MBLA0076]|uniref:CGCGG family rSAM-modified RiPP protein n=1 Tax=Haloferax litoreum TaxID=2666140 RepID=A0A6A8GJD3_9EURY|nr:MULTISPECIES: CGCGG family rSAM-modified RiPP protein [Haloferax]KAB1190378.1 CGCGG family rSAM-modified RiPP protein [Haloferax sp. CBA1148]MRX23348.1 CGCGG family rSAM-modified RiPP protein [Haloferax litoreum]